MIRNRHQLDARRRWPKEPYADNVRRRLNGVDMQGVWDSVAPLLETVLETGDFWLLIDLQRDVDASERVLTISATESAPGFYSPYRSVTGLASGSGGGLRYSVAPVGGAGATAFVDTADTLDSARHLVLIRDYITSGSSADIDVAMDGGSFGTAGTYTRVAWTPDYVRLGAFAYGATPSYLAGWYGGDFFRVVMGEGKPTAAEFARMAELQAAGALDLRVHFPHLPAIFDDWCGDSVDTTDVAINHAERYWMHATYGNGSWANMTDADLVVG